MKIIKIVTNQSEIWRILKKNGWPTTTHDFDEAQDLVEWEICQLIPGTADGFPEEYNHQHTSGPDPPTFHYEDNIDPPHWEDPFIQYD